MKRILQWQLKVILTNIRQEAIKVLNAFTDNKGGEKDRTYSPS